MTESRDHSDQQVQGLERYFPTSLSRSLIIAFFTLPFAGFWLVLENSSELLPSDSDTEDFLVAVIAGLVVALFTLVGLVIDAACVSYQAKHRRIRHFSLEHPEMSFASLLQNATSKHYIFIVVIFLLGMLLGTSL